MLGFAGREVEALSIAWSAEVDPHTGSAATRIPVLAPPGRSLTPPLTLMYRSGAGNSAFGTGWSLGGLPSISLDTSRHVARWDGTDGFALGGDELAPWLEKKAGVWTPRGFERGDWSVAYFRSRRGSSRTRVEKWLHRPTGRLHFRSRDAENVLTVYGARPNAAARIADPDDETRTLTWLPELLVDPHGDALWLDYAAETADGVARDAAFERRRVPLAQRYLKRILYGNDAPLAVTDAVLSGAQPAGIRWVFQLVLDYGDHDPATAAAAPDRPWPARVDPFSTNRHGFELRSFRLCRRILSFHHFAELGPDPSPVSALTLSYQPDPAGSTLIEVARVGYRRDAGALTSKTVPPLRFAYSAPATGAEFIAPTALENVPAGFASRRTTFIDLLGDGMPGILTETDRAWFYKTNLGGGDFAAQTLVMERPAARAGSAGLGDADGDGDTDLSVLSGRFAGLFEHDREQARWENFRPFGAFPHVEALGDKARWVDLNGDGLPDLVISKEDRLLWFASDGDGFEPPVDVPQPGGGDAAPTLRSDVSMEFFFADMTGDGLADFVRVGLGCVEYWPSLGNGRFGERVIMADAPQFDADCFFDPQRLRFVDLDGSGTSDIVYIGRGEASCWINASGNRFSAGPRLRSLPYFDSLSNVRIYDFLGDGRACLVWSSPLPGLDAPLHYLPLTPAVHPRLLTDIEDRTGRAAQFVYSSSATHYLRDRAAGRDWRTRFAAHRMVVDRQDEIDLIGKTRSSTSYAYHDGYFDGVERTPRGFGQVDVIDSAPVAGANPAETFAAPSMTRLWFHLGTAMWDRHRPGDTYDADPDLPWLGAHVIEDDGTLDAEEIEDGLRAMAGLTIRREVFALDAKGAPGPHPISVSQERRRLRRLQPGWGTAKAAFFAAPVEQADWIYEQQAGDPRTTHKLAIAFDAYDQPLRQASVAYARRAGKPRDVATQDRSWVTVSDAVLINIDEPDRYELSLLTDSRTLELVGLRPGPTGLFAPAQFTAAPAAAALAAPLLHDADPPDDPAQGPKARLIGWERKFYWNDARDGAAPFGAVGAVTLAHHDETACFSPAFLAATLGGRIDDAGVQALGYAGHDGLWWQAGETQIFAPAAEFSQRAGVLRGDGAKTQIAYDADRLLPVSVTDPLGNVTTADNDYNRLAPFRITDANGNVEEVRYDALGVIVAESRIGHVGDAAWGFEPLAAVAARAPADVAAAVADPKTLIQGAAAYCWYDLGAFDRDGSPTAKIELTREELLHDGAGSGRDGAIGIAVSYFDGFGRALQRKALAEPGPAIQRDGAGKIVLDAAGQPLLAPADPRWRASGHTAYDSKQQPIRVYDPFCSPSAAYEGDDALRQFGSATLLLYDAAGRISARHFPNGTFSGVTTGAWRIEDADANDTVLGSAWAALREGLAPDSAEWLALEEARPHAGTARIVYLDPFGRPAGSLDPGGAGAPDRKIEERADIAGRALDVTDARGLSAFSYKRDMLGRLVEIDSADAGRSYSIADACDRNAIGWDARGFVSRFGYDLADRPTFVDVTGGDGAVPMNHRVETYLYGESLADRNDARRRNALGRALTARDAATETRIEQFDPDGRVLRSSQQLRAEPDRDPDWRQAEALDAETVATAAVFDALGRLRSDRLADGSSRAYDYAVGGALARVRLTTPDGQLTDAPIVDGATYGAYGQRTALRLGNGVQLTYGYEADTRRLATQTATLAGKTLQQLGYTYDPVGNIVQIRDGAQEAAAGLIAGLTVTARRDYAYDAHYRLRQASGRVHQALLQWDIIPGAANTVKGSRRISFNDGAAVERYSRTYDYDASGNMTRLRHQGATRNWTTDFWVSATSNRSLPAQDPNGDPVAAPEGRFDAGGNLRVMSHLREMAWGWSGALRRAVAISRPGGVDDDERYAYGAHGRRMLRRTTRQIQPGLIEVTEKAYFGDAERKRIRRNGQIVLERWTLHVADGEQRVAFIDRWTRDDLKREVDAIGAPLVRYQLASQQRSAVMELDAAGKLITYEEYFPYGDTAFVVGDAQREVERREYRYSGKERDDFTGFYYYGYRYLVPWMARWLSPDPLGPGDDLNLYQFVLGNPVSNVDPDGLQTETLVRYGGVSGKAKTGAAAMREFNNAHALELGFLVTKVERLPSGDWLIKETKPLSPSLRATAERLHGNVEAAQQIEDLGNALKEATGALANAGDAPAADANSADPGGGAGPGAGDAPGSGPGAGVQGSGKDAAGQGGGPAKDGDASDDKTVKEGKAGGTGVGTGAGAGVGAGTGSDPNATSTGGKGKTGAPATGAKKGGGGPGGIKGGKGVGPGGSPKGVPGGQGTGSPTGNDAHTGSTSGGQTGGPGGVDSGGSTDPRLAPSATGQPPAPGVTKQGRDPAGTLDGGTADTAQPATPGTPAEHGHGGANGRAGGTGDSPTAAANAQGGPGGRPGGASDGSPDGAEKGMPGGGGTHELPWYLSPLKYLGKAIQVVGAVLEIAAGLAMLLVPEPTITKVGGVILLLHGLDSLQAAIRGDRTFTAKGATCLARKLGASEPDAMLIGDLADIAVPLIAGGLGAIGKAGVSSGRFALKPGWKIPGTGPYARWLTKGIENDARLLQMSAKDRSLYELGQRTLSNKAFAAMGKALGTATQTGQSIEAAIARGVWLKGAKAGLFNFAYRPALLTLLKTLGTGPSPAVRAYGSIVFPIFSSMMSVLGKSLLFIESDGQRAY